MSTMLATQHPGWETVSDLVDMSREKRVVAAAASPDSTSPAVSSNKMPFHVSSRGGEVARSPSIGRINFEVIITNPKNMYRENKSGRDSFKVAYKRKVNGKKKKTQSKTFLYFENFKLPKHMSIKLSRNVLNWFSVRQTTISGLMQPPLEKTVHRPLCCGLCPHGGVVEPPQPLWRSGFFLVGTLAMFAEAPWQLVPVTPCTLE